MHEMTLSQRFIEFLLIGVVVMMAQSVLYRFQRRKAKAHDGWRYLTPGPMVWTALVLSSVTTSFLTYIYLFVGSSRADAASQMHVLQVLTIAFNLATIVLAYFTLAEDVRWNAHGIERRTVFFRRLSMGWNELASAGSEASGYWWIKSYSGPKIRFSPYANGFSELMRTIISHLPTKLPPAEQQALSQALVAFAQVRTR